MIWLIVSAIIFFQVVVIVALVFFRGSGRQNLKPASTTTPNSVGKYYNETTDKFLKVYGEIIQAFRTKDVKEYLDYTIKSARFKDGMKLLDAGCGVAGPAIHFAQQLPNVSIEACTISAVQAKMAEEKIISSGLQKRVRVMEGDYHLLDSVVEKNSFDCVYFLESFGHSNDKTKVFDTAWEVLKPGGMIYIKDLFRREVSDEWEQLRINSICEQINSSYHYQIEDLNDVLSIIRKKGYILHFVKIPEVELSAFEQLSISNDFQNLFNIGKIESWDDYVFPIDFFEILAEKPIYNLNKDKHLYFMNQK